MPVRKKICGVGATVSCNTRFLHPSAIIRARYVNNKDALKTHRTIGLLLVRQQVMMVSRREQLCYIVTHPEYTDADGGLIELHLVVSHFKCEVEGDRDLFFTHVVTAELQAEIEQPTIFPTEIRNFNLAEDDLRLLERNGIEVDDDNAPAPENIDQTTDPNAAQFGDWGSPHVCHRRSKGLGKSKAQLVEYRPEFGTELNLEQLFELLFPVDYVKDVIIHKINETIKPTTTYGEFLRWLGLWLLMSTTRGSHRREFWNTLPVSHFKGAPFRLGEYMDRNRFEEILKAIRYTNMTTNRPDKFFEVRQLQDEWNKNMTKNFIPSWVSCLDESMSMWTNPFSCPGFMYVPRKPHPFGNEYHSVCCGETQVMWQVELVEGKDSPPPHDFRIWRQR